MCDVKLTCTHTNLIVNAYFLQSLKCKPDDPSWKLELAQSSKS